VLVDGEWAEHRQSSRAGVKISTLDLLVLIPVKTSPVCQCCSQPNKVLTHGLVAVRQHSLFTGSLLLKLLKSNGLFSAFAESLSTLAPPIPACLYCSIFVRQQEVVRRYTVLSNVRARVVREVFWVKVNLAGN